jgi:hypothetical protein
VNRSTVVQVPADVRAAKCMTTYNFATADSIGVLVFCADPAPPSALRLRGFLFKDGLSVEVRDFGSQGCRFAPCRVQTKS